MTQHFFSIPIYNATKKYILEKIKKFIFSRDGFLHIVSLNPENIVISHDHADFKLVLQKAHIHILDGIGTYAVAKLKKIENTERVTGIEMMENLLNLANIHRLKVLLIGGKEKVANKVVECQSKKYPHIHFFSTHGIKNIKKPEPFEEKNIFSIVLKEKPHFVFVAFGSPYQELWLDNHQIEFKGCVCMGVGQGFDVLSRTVPRAPAIIRKAGFEWLYRLIIQPWRWKRQLRLIRFIGLAIKELGGKY